MKTSRLKNIVIVILLLVNAFLLFLLLSRRAEERDCTNPFSKPCAWMKRHTRSYSAREMRLSISVPATRALGVYCAITLT